MSRSFNSFECKLNVTVVGGFCKLMFHFQMVRIEMSMVLFRPLQKIRRRNFGNLYTIKFTQSYCNNVLLTLVLCKNSLSLKKCFFSKICLCDEP
jgi:hypothetical protein